MKLSLCLSIVLLGCAVLVSAQSGYKYDAATVSGLPARNIGSAAMSGRVAAVDAVEQDGRTTVFVARPAAAFGSRSMAARPSNRFSIVRACNPSER